MKRIFLLSSILCLFCVNAYSSEKVIWKGEVQANGQPTNTIKLTLHKKYQIKVSGYLNLGKWIQNKEELANDACYEFSPTSFTTKLEAFQNSHDIPVCDGTYHSDHSYQSKPFIAAQDRIHFWVYDTYYDDNTGAFQVEVIELNDK